MKHPDIFLEELQKQNKDIRDIVNHTLAAWAATEDTTNSPLLKAVESVKENPLYP